MWRCGGSSCSGVIRTPQGDAINVAYIHAGGIYTAATQTGCGTDYWSVGNPYTSSTLANRPRPCDMIALSNPGSQTVSFSKPVRNVFLSYISLNGNGYTFDHDFDLLSSGTGFFDGGGPNQSFKDGFSLLGTGEPHGTVGFPGTWESLTWISMSFEIWNGFTIGIRNSEDEFCPE